MYLTETVRVHGVHVREYDVSGCRYFFRLGFATPKRNKQETAPKHVKSNFVHRHVDRIRDEIPITSKTNKTLEGNRTIEN